MPAGTGNGNLVRQALGGLARVRGWPCDVTRPSDGVIPSRGRDERPAVGVTNKNDRARHTTEPPLYRVDITSNRVEPELRRKDLVAFLLKHRDYPVEGRCVSPKAVNQDDARLCQLRHGQSPGTRFIPTLSRDVSSIASPSGP